MTPTSTARTRTDTEVTDDVTTELRWVPDVDDTHIDVSVSAGVVTLSGQVDSRPEKLAAGRATQRVRGVCAVVQELTVRTHIGSTREADLARQASEAIRGAVATLAGLRDVPGVDDVRPAVAASAVHARIAAALVGNARADGEAITVGADGAGVVAVRGTVRSWADQRQVELTCWSAPEVTDVVVELTVQP